MDRNTGVIRTTSSFDREAKNEYYITVVAEDGAPSDRPNHYPPGTPNQGQFASFSVSLNMQAVRVVMPRLGPILVLAYKL